MAENKKILYQLEKNCRQPLSQIGKKVGLSREVVSYRIKQLEKKEVIPYYLTVVDYVKLGYTFCRVWFKYNIVSKEIENKIIEFAKESPYINWVAIGDGLYNMVLVYLVKNINTIEDEFDKFQYMFGKYIVDFVPSTAFKIYHFKHSYLYKNHDRTPVVVGGHENQELSISDKRILDILVENPRINFVKLSQELRISAKTISKKVENMMRKGIIKQFKAKINTNVLGYEHQKVLLYLRNQTKEKVNAIINYLKHEDRVIFITKPFSIAGLEFEMIVKSKREIYEFLRMLMEQFPQTIRDYNVCLIYSEPLSKYLCQDDSL